MTHLDFNQLLCFNAASITIANHLVIGSSAVQRRPLPPVPGGSDSTTVLSSPVEARRRPLPATPAPGVHINPVGPQTSPLVQKKRIAQPPPKPSPYRKNKSEPSPPTYRKSKPNHSPPPSLQHQQQLPPPPQFARSASLSPPPNLLLAEDYQDFVTQFQPESCDYEFPQSQPESCDYEFGVELNAVEDNYSLATSGKSPQCVLVSIVMSCTLSCQFL